VEALRSLAGGRVQLPGDPGYDAARHGFALAVDQHPAAVAHPRTAGEIATAVRVAADQGLRVAVWSTGHDPAPLGDLGDTLLLRTDEMRAVSVDPATRRVRAAAGARWQDVVGAVAPHGLTVLHGS
jgi:FAD/FMN-containing dehydrogenase